MMKLSTLKKMNTNRLHARYIREFSESVFNPYQERQHMIARLVAKPGIIANEFYVAEGWLSNLDDASKAKAIAIAKKLEVIRNSGTPCTHVMPEPKGHGKRGRKAQFTTTQVFDMFRMSEMGMSLTQIGKQFNVSAAVVTHILSGKTYKWIHDACYSHPTFVNVTILK